MIGSGHHILFGFGLGDAHGGQPSKETGKACTHRAETLATPSHHKSVCADDTEFSELVEGLGNDFFQPLLVPLPEKCPSLQYEPTRDGNQARGRNELAKECNLRPL